MTYGDNVTSVMPRDTNNFTSDIVYSTLQYGGVITVTQQPEINTVDEGHSTLVMLLLILVVFAIGYFAGSKR